MNEKFPKLSDLYENAGDPSGDVSFRGGPYGFGGNRQLVAINPATAAIEKQTQDEINSNVDRRSWVIRTDRRLPPIEPQDLNERSPAGAAIKESDEILQEREASDILYRDLPGWPPQPNALVLQKDFVPDPDNKLYLDPLSGQPLEYLGATLDFSPIEDIDTDDWHDLEQNYIIKINQIQLDLQTEEFKSQSQRAYFYAMANKGGKKGKKWKRMASEFEKSIPKNKKLPKKINKESLIANKSPMSRGYNNMQGNALVRPAVFIDPKSNIIDEPIDPVGSMGAIGYPKKFIPDDYEARLKQHDQYIMGTDNILGGKRLQMHQNPILMPEENTYTEELTTLDEDDMNETISETEKKSAAEKHKVRRSNSMSGMGMGTTALSEIIDYLVSEELKIRNLSPSSEETGLHGSQVFEKNRKEILKDLHSEELNESKFCIDTDEELMQKKAKHINPTKPKAWARSKRIAKSKFGLKPTRRILNWPSVRAVAKAEELYRQAGGKWKKIKRRGAALTENFDIENDSLLIENISFEDVLITKLLLEKNVPTNPSLWSRAKAAARSKFDVYPCVPMNSLAITKNGPESYHNLAINDEILTYSIQNDVLEWKPILNIHHFDEAPLVEMGKATGFKIKCTPNHKWVVKSGSEYQNISLVETKDINKHMQLVCCSELNNHNDLILENWSKKNSWTEKVLSMSKQQREIFLASAIVYDGHDQGISTKIENRHTFGFSQKNEDHFYAAILAATLNGYHVSFSDKYPEMKSATIIRNKKTHNTQNLIIEDAGTGEVWCPETQNNTWVMIQNGFVTITGNSAYANAWASKWYKSKGGGWRKKGKKK